MIASTIILKSPILSWLAATPAIGAALILCLPAGKTRIIRNAGLIFALLTFALAIVAAAMFNWNKAATDHVMQLTQSIPWLRILSSQYMVGADSLSMPLLLLVGGLCVVICVASHSVERQVKGYFVLFLLTVSLVVGALATADLLAFYIFCQLAIIPFYFLIGLWGGAGKEVAAGKFVIQMVLSGIIVLIGILGVHSFAGNIHSAEGAGQGSLAEHPFDLAALAQNRQLAGRFMPRSAAEQAFGPQALLPTDGSGVWFAELLFGLFCVGFALLIPAAGVHTWLIHTLSEAPTPIAMLVAGVVPLLGGYGFFRIVYPLFPHQVAQFWWWIALAGVITIVYGALGALAQKNLKRLVAYVSVSQMGFVLLGLAVLTPAGSHGAVFMLMAHAINFGLLFFIAGVIEERAHHCDIDRLSGLATQMPGYASFAAIGFFAAMGVPAFSGFVAQLLVIFGSFSAAGIEPSESPLIPTASHNIELSVMAFAIVAAASTIITAGCLIWTLQRIFLGAPRPEHHHFSPLLRYERMVLLLLCAATFALGVYPGPLLSHLPEFSHTILQRVDAAGY